MSKLLCVVSCPIDCYSGYSERSRDLVKSLIKVKGDEWDIRILSQRWGSTPWGYLKNHNEIDLQNRIIPQLHKQPDIWMQITVPNEFQPVGKYNIGVSAIVETTICDATWIEGCNRMDLNLVSSNHSKQVILNSKFEKKDNRTQQIIENIEIKKPVEVLFEGIQIPDFEYINTLTELDQIEEKFCFLVVGHWLQGILGEDRKNIGMTIKVFLETFKNKKNKPALVLKTSGGTSSIMDREQTLKKIDEIRATVVGDLPNIYLLHGELAEKEIKMLYSHPKIKAMVSLTKGEGYGRPLAEFALTKKPIVCSAWSAPVDFLDTEFSCLVKGELKPVHPSAVVPNMILAESAWFTPDYPTAGLFLKDIFENYDNYTEKSKRQAYKVKSQFSWEKMNEKLNDIFELRLPNFPKPVELAIPKLNKISLPKKPITIQI